jgi:peptidoglycan hydrolase-like protein with peptidoglycan-binding domain
MTNNLIESFLKYEEQRKTQKNPNEFQSVKSLQERNIIRRANRNATAGAGEALRPEIAGPEQGPPVSAMARPGDTRFGNFNSNGTVRGSTVTGNATAARAGVRTEPEAIDPVRAAANAGLSMTTPGADMSVTNSGGDQVSIIPGRTSDGEPLRRGLQRGGQPMIGPEGKNTDTPAPPAPPATPARPNDGNNRVSAPSQATLNTRPGLRAGSASADTVKAFQRELGITADGVAGPQTRQAVMDFQRKHGLQVDGIIGDQTRMAFERSMANYRTESVQFSEAELAHFRSILEAMPVAPTAEGHGPNPTPKNKAEGGKGRGSLSEMKKK